MELLQEKQNQVNEKFKKSLYKYLIVNAFLWCIWYIGTDIQNLSQIKLSTVWPIYPTLGWGFALAMKYVNRNS